MTESTEPKKLPPYSGRAAVCVKCRTKDAATDYRNELMHGELLVAAVPGPFEWLRRTCRNCGYHWREACVPKD